MGICTSTSVAKAFGTRAISTYRSNILSECKRIGEFSLIFLLNFQNIKVSTLLTHYLRLTVYINFLIIKGTQSESHVKKLDGAHADL